MTPTTPVNESNIKSLTTRDGVRLEAIVTRGMGVLTVGVGLAYLFGLVFLLFRGGLRVVSFTSYASPLQGIEGEERMRFVLAAVLFAAAAWGLTTTAKRFVPALHETNGRRGTRIFIAVAALAGALLARDHLPRFLIALPSETRAGGGIGPEIFNTLYFAILSTAVTLPMGVGAAVYIARFAKAQGFVSVVRVALDTLASLPSIVYGLFGFLVFVVEMKAGYSLVAGAFVLALVNLPLVVGVAEEAIRAVPRELEDGSLALGATPVQTVLRVTLPYAWPGILSAIVLSIGRVFAESAPLIMTAGTTISRSTAFSLDPFRGGETLAVHLWYVNSAGLSPDKAEVSAGTAAVLVILVALTNVAAARLGRLAGVNAPARLKKATR
jgi:phosphate transport system permease protein